MLVRKNTKEFKAIRNLLEMYADDPARQKNIRLFIVKAGETLHSRRPIDELGAEASFYYDLNYSTILGNLRSSDHRLHKSKVPGLYFFKSPHFPKWEQTPFQLPKALLDKLDDFATKNTRAKAQRAIDALPEDEAVFAGDDAARRPKKEKPVKAKTSKKKTEKKKVEKEEPKRLTLGKKHKIHFENIEKKVFTQGDHTLQDVLEYYASVNQYMFPYIAGRPHSFALGSGKTDFVRSIERLKEKNIALPAWVKKVKMTAKTDKQPRHYFVCSDADHFYQLLQTGSIELHPWHSTFTDLSHPDYFVINLRPYTDWFSDVVEVALAVREVLGDSFDSYVKLSEHKGLHIYVRWKEKVSYELSYNVATMVARQAHALTKRLSALQNDEAKKENRILIDVSVNSGESARTVIAPYSLIRDSNGLVAAPLMWSEVTRKLDPEAFNIRTMSERLSETGDVLEGLLG